MAWVPDMWYWTKSPKNTTTTEARKKYSQIWNPYKGLFTRESDFALGQPIFLNIKIIIFCKRHQLAAKLHSKIGCVNKP